MHVCEEFRERITDQIIDRRDLDNDLELQRELLVCNQCLDFYAESREVIEAISGVEFEMPEAEWEQMADRMRYRLRAEHAGRNRVPFWRRAGFAGRNLRIYVPALAGAAAMLLITLAVSRLATPLIETAGQEPTAAVLESSPLAVVNPDAMLDPVTLDYLAQSEMLLRDVMKLKPSSTEALKKAQAMADRQLVDLVQRKEAAAQVQPVVNMMDKYEMILRDIRNLRGPTTSEDITDIKNRIERNGLIAEMGAFQPRSTLETEQGENH